MSQQNVGRRVYGVWFNRVCGIWFHTVYGVFFNTVYGVFFNRVYGVFFNAWVACLDLEQKKCCACSRSCPQVLV
jgi:hypothetical protein